MVATFILASLAIAELSYCEPCTDETLDGIAWTSGNLANNFEYDGVARRNDDYAVLVKQSCAAGFTGTATRICDGNGAWKNAVLSGCQSNPCQSVPADFEDYLNINNGEMKTNCPKGSAGGFECDVVCKASFHPVLSKMMCYGGQWSTKGIACQPEPQNNAIETTEGPSTVPGSQSSEPDETVQNENAEKGSTPSHIGLIVAVCVALAVLLIAVYVMYSLRSTKANAGEVMSSAGSNRSHRHYNSSSGSRRGRSRQ